MQIKLPMLHQEIVNNELKETETMEVFDIDTSIYSEERWEQNFPALAQKEGLFQYITRIEKTQVAESVRVASMLKAIYCFVESSKVPTYKDFAKMFVLSSEEYTERLINTLRSAFSIILRSSVVKNSQSTAND